MTNKSVDIANLVEELEDVLTILDESGESLAAIKLDEAIHLLRDRMENQPSKLAENRD